ncbi:MAG: glycosyltransferase, partial [Planctomycetia bacterium]|nr:glycosyltransferase [Planctomycetia bacterium]
MGRVCLILPLASSSALSGEWVSRCRKGLEDSGHTVRIHAVLDGREPRAADKVVDVCAWSSAVSRGLSSAAMTGLRESEAQADYLIVLSPDRGYEPGDLARLIEPLEEDRADLAVGCRIAGPDDSRFRRLTRAAVGTVAR